MKQFKYKIFYLPPPLSQFNSLDDWQSESNNPFDYSSNIDEILLQPYRVAAVHAMFNVENSFTYNKILADVDWSKFDLVMISEAETYSPDEILSQCIIPAGIKNYLLAVGAFVDGLDKNTIYRPWWIFNHLELNSNFNYKELNKKPFIFEALLGQGRPHRNYVMARFQSNRELLDKSIVTYRNLFGVQDDFGRRDLLQEIDTVLQGQELLRPYESPNLNPDWEVSVPNGKLDNRISEITPWEIYNQTYYSVVCETNWYNPIPNPADPVLDHPGPFFITEKMAKVLLGHRLFVMFGPMHILKFFREQGFKTFGNIIDESYDECSNIPERFRRAFDQVEYLATLDPVEVLSSTLEIRKYNFERLIRYKKQKRNTMQEMVLNFIPEQHIIG